MNTKTSMIHSIKSEVQKLWTPAIRNTSIIGLAIYLLMIFVISNPSDYQDYLAESNLFSYRFATQNWSLLVLFASIVGTLAVTSEYSHNTMRTTLLATPNRLKAAGTKFVAVALWALGYFGITFLLSALLAKIRLGSVMVHQSGDFFAILVALILLLATALLSTAFGYLLRSTAGALAMMIFIFYIIEIVRFIPRKFFYETIPHWLPTTLAERAMEVGQQGEGNLFMPPADQYFSSPWLALAIYCIYVLVAVIVAFLVYQKRDA